VTTVAAAAAASAALASLAVQQTGWHASHSCRPSGENCSRQRAAAVAAAAGNQLTGWLTGWQAGRLAGWPMGGAAAAAAAAVAGWLWPRAQQQQQQQQQQCCRVLRPLGAAAALPGATAGMALRGCAMQLLLQHMLCNAIIS
jgi:hypothetical protein